jgi:hypothetical protein
MVRRNHPVVQTNLWRSYPVPMDRGDEATRERRLNVVVVVCTILAIPLDLYVAGVGGIGLFNAYADTSVDAPDCGEFSFDEGDWTDEGDPDGRAVQALGLAKCGDLVRLDGTQVRSMLGSPSDAGPGFLDYAIPQSELAPPAATPRHLRVHLEGGRATRVGFDQGCPAYEAAAWDPVACTAGGID